MKSTTYFKHFCLVSFFIQWLQLSQVNSKEITLNAVYHYESVKSNEENPNAAPCPSKGILVQSIKVVLIQKPNCTLGAYKYLNGTDLTDSEKSLVKMVLKECNGRSDCQLSKETWNIKPTLNCNSSQLPADEFTIKGQCLDTEPNNETVYDFHEIQEVSFKNKMYLISRNKELNRVCQISGTDKKISLTILYLDNSLSQQWNKSTLISIKDKSSDISFCFESGNVKSIINKSIDVRNATIVVTMGKGFLWMLLEADNASDVSCEDRNTSESTCEDFKGTIHNKGTELRKSNIYESINSIEKTIAISFGIVLGIPIIICLLLGVIRFRKRNPACNVCVKVKKCEILTRKKQPGQRSKEEKKNISSKILMNKNTKAEEESSQQTQNPKDCIYFQLEKCSDTHQFTLTDDTNKSMSWDESKEDVNAMTRLESDYSHLHFSSRQKMQNCENIYSG